MVRALRFMAWPAVLGMVLVAGMGCPLPSPGPPDYLAAFLLTPEALDFGATKDSLSLQVAKNYTSQPLPEFSISTGGANWLSVNPKTGSSSGPTDPVKVTVSVDRSKMVAGENLGLLTISAPGVEPQTVEVTAKALLVADFSAAPLVANVKQKVQFADESSAAAEAGNIVSWLWTFGDGQTSTDRNPVHKYKAAGTYSVSLTVQTQSLSDTQVKQNYVTVQEGGGPIADFEASDTSPVANTPVEFFDLSDPGDGTIEQWFWSFGDGGTSLDQNPTHTYTLTGKFTVSLTVTSSTGQDDTETKSKYINVRPQGPTANFTSSTRFPDVGEPVQFSDLSDPGTSSITDWLWNFGDGGTSSLQNPQHIYTAAAAYTVYLGVTTDVGVDGETKLNYIVVSP